jgi:hypothetical protein
MKYWVVCIAACGGSGSKYRRFAALVASIATSWLW